MATNIDYTYKLKAAESTVNRGCFSVFDTATAGQVKNPAGANAGEVAGVLVDSTLEAEKNGCYRKFGYAYVRAAGAVAVGSDLVIADTQGRVTGKGTGAHTSGTDILGRAEEAASAANDIILAFVDITPFTS